jgi:hypothetical protein
MINRNDFFQIKDDQNSGSGFSLCEDNEDTQINIDQKPEFDTYGTALNEL